MTDRRTDNAARTPPKKESPADTIRRAAELIREDAMRSEADDPTRFSRTFELRLADSWFALADETADYPAVRVPLGVGIAFRPDQPSNLWTHTYNAALAYLGEAPDA